MTRDVGCVMGCTDLQPIASWPRRIAMYVRRLTPLLALWAALPIASAQNFEHDLRPAALEGWREAGQAVDIDGDWAIVEGVRPHPNLGLPAVEDLPALFRFDPGTGSGPSTRRSPCRTWWASPPRSNVWRSTRPTRCWAPWSSGRPRTRCSPGGSIPSPESGRRCRGSSRPSAASSASRRCSTSTERPRSSRTSATRGAASCIGTSSTPLPRRGPSRRPGARPRAPVRSGSASTWTETPRPCSTSTGTRALRAGSTSTSAA